MLTKVLLSTCLVFSLVAVGSSAQGEETHKIHSFKLKVKKGNPTGVEIIAKKGFTPAVLAVDVENTATKNRGLVTLELFHSGMPGTKNDSLERLYIQGEKIYAIKLSNEKDARTPLTFTYVGKLLSSGDVEFAKDLKGAAYEPATGSGGPPLVVTIDGLAQKQEAGADRILFERTTSGTTGAPHVPAKESLAGTAK